MNYDLRVQSKLKCKKGLYMCTEGKITNSKETAGKGALDILV